MQRERLAWKEALLWLFAFVTVSGLGLMIEAKAANRLFDERRVAQAVEGLRGQVRPRVGDFFAALISPQEQREWEWLNREYGLGLPNVAGQAMQLFDSGWREVAQTAARVARAVRETFDAVAMVGLLAALAGLIGAGLVGRWWAVGEHLMGALLANGAMCILIYLAVVAALGKAAQSVPTQAILVAHNLVGGFQEFQLAVGIPLLILGGAGTLALYLLQPKDGNASRPRPTTRSAQGPRAW